MKQIKKADSKASKVNGFLIAGIVALIVTIVGYGLLIFIENKVLGGYNLVDVYVFAEDYGKGSVITGNEFTKMSIDMSIVPDGTITDIESLKGKYLSSGVKKNQICMADDFIVKTDDAERYLELTFTTANMNNNLTGTLRASDYIDIYFIPNGLGEQFDTAVFTGENFYLQMLQNRLEEMLISYEEGVGNVIDEKEYYDIKTILNRIRELKGNKDAETSDYTTLFTEYQEIVQELLKEYKRCLESLGTLEPDYERIYIEEAYTQDGIKVSNLDKTSIASQFKVKLSKEESRDFITKQQYCSIWIVKNNS